MTHYCCKYTKNVDQPYLDWCLNNPKNVDWDDISQNEPLTEDFIRKTYDKVNWWLIVQCQKLSESFIREMADYVAWNYVGCEQKLSEDFIREFNVRIW